ncbi:Ribonuclease Z [Lachnospiraceae bacterium TWA4]|nr:Ribonuclease Z [Lachnospiraceae bacterium TWA4]
MHITLLGTGNAFVTECYNTCFTLHFNNKNDIFLVDAGGGNTILSQLKKANINYTDIKNIFVTHKHIDHILGVIWMIRAIGKSMQHGTYTSDCNIYSHAEVIDILRRMSKELLNKKEIEFLDNRIHLITITDGESKIINNQKVTFFDIHSTKATQYGFSIQLENGKKLTCCGDEPFNDHEISYVRGADWLLHEAFCLFSQIHIFKPYDKHHSTVKDACEVATRFNIKNLILYHTEDKNIANRKELYTKEGKKYFTDNLYIPDDLEVIELN